MFSVAEMTEQEVTKNLVNEDSIKQIVVAVVVGEENGIPIIRILTNTNNINTKWHKLFYLLNPFFFVWFMFCLFWWF
uniref:Uncharacterized protein n=1 Tax=Panagrolaimus sp. ES5 TaxID=591445 RepID=A0AC34FHB2_9BILA